MTLADFHFDLPASQIAQAPSARRGESRLLALGRRSAAVTHHRFADIVGFLRSGDVLVVNDTRVVPARLVGRKDGTGGRAELLLVRPLVAPIADTLTRPPASSPWLCLGQASKGFKAGAALVFEGGLSAKVVEVRGGGEYVVSFEGGTQALGRVLERAGQLPLPPYIARPPTAQDAERYQTVYARVPGSVAAPTAGLHFTPEVLSALDTLGVERAPVTLEVGPGTFLPVREEQLERHVMHLERYAVPEDTARIVTAARREGRRVIAVGTTSVRTLESAWDTSAATLRSGEGETCLFIRPGFAFNAVDALITNFHLPRSTLLMLVSAFAGRESVLAAYSTAVRAGYRFFSYGDAMWIGD